MRRHTDFLHQDRQNPHGLGRERPKKKFDQLAMSMPLARQARLKLP
jgi:hypothetical protein